MVLTTPAQTTSASICRPGIRFAPNVAALRGLFETVLSICLAWLKQPKHCVPSSGLPRHPATQKRVALRSGITDLLSSLSWDPLSGTEEGEAVMRGLLQGSATPRRKTDARGAGGAGYTSSIGKGVTFSYLVSLRPKDAPVNAFEIPLSISRLNGDSDICKTCHLVVRSHLQLLRHTCCSLWAMRDLLFSSKWIVFRTQRVWVVIGG